MSNLSNLNQRAMLVSLNVKVPSNSKRDVDSTQELTESRHAKEGSARVTKSLFSKEAVSSYTAPVAEARKILAEMSLPWTQKGTRILLAENYMGLLEKVSVQEKAYWSAADRFKENFLRHIDESRSALGLLFREDDYPTQQELEAMFEFTLSFMPLPDDGDFRVSLGAEEEARMKANIRRQVEATVHSAAVEPYARVKSAIGALVTRLEERAKQEEDGVPNGKRLTPIKTALLDNLSDLGQSLTGLNILKDPKMEEIGKDIETLLRGVEPENLKGSAHVQRALAGQAKQLSSKVDQYAGLI